MRNSFYSAALCAATLIGFSSCSDSLTEIPDAPDRTSRSEIASNIWIEGPSKIELGQLYFFDVKGNNANGFNFKIEDTYFNDPTSYAIYISPAGNRIGLIFNEYGHFKITAVDTKTGSSCSYEVAKYNKAVHYLKYNNDAPTIYIGMVPRQPVKQWFESYANRNTATMDYSGRITSFDHRIVVNVKEGTQLYWWTNGTNLKITPSEYDSVITCTADKGDSVITLPEKMITRHPSSSSTTLNYGYYVPWCSGSYTIPAERCGAL